MLATKKILAVAIAAATFISSANAALVNHGNWTRGDANSVYAEWDFFNALSDDSADVGTANLAAGSVTLASGMVLGGGNQYSFFSTGNWTVSITGNSTGPVVGDSAVAYLQIRTTGTELDTSSVTLAGQSANSITLLESIVSEFGGSPSYDNLYLFSWNTTGLPTWNFAFNSVGAHTSLDKLAVDIQTTAVPVPAAAWLMGSGLVGLTAVARRRKA
jgi:hypothetical protein